MPGTATTLSRETTDVVASAGGDDLLTLCAVSILAFIVGNVLCEAGRAAVALLTISPAGWLSSVGWSSAYDNAWVDASGALIGLIAALLFWTLLRSFQRAGSTTRLFLLLGGAFTALSGAGHFVIAGLTDFGDWYTLLRGLHRWNAVSVSLLAGGVLAYGFALVAIGREFRAFADRRQVRRILRVAWRAAIAVYLCSAVLNPGGAKEVALTNLPITVISEFGLLFVFLLVPKRAAAAGDAVVIRRCVPFISVATVCALLYLFVLGRGLMLTR